MLLCRYADPDSASSSFSILLGDAPHLDRQVCLLHLPKIISRDCFKISSDIISNESDDNFALQYAIFGKVTKGDETLKKLEQLPTHKEGIFVMVFFQFAFNVSMLNNDLDSGNGAFRLQFQTEDLQ